MEIKEIIRRWQAGVSPSLIASGTGLSRNTVRKYLSAAQAEGVARDGPGPTEDQLSRLATISQSGPRQVATPGQDLLEPWADQIYQWLTGDRLLMTRIHELLLVRGCAVSYSSLQRFVAKRNWRRAGKSTVRMADTPPGEVAEADFGRLGMITDPATGKRKAVWAMVIVLCHSRHCFVWPMQQHKLPDVIAGLEATWAFFGGMPKYLVVDNFPAPWPVSIRWNPASPRAFWSMPSTEASSPTQPGYIIPRTNPRSNARCPTHGSASSRAPTSTTSPMCAPPAPGGVWKSPVRATTAPQPAAAGGFPR